MEIRPLLIVDGDNLAHRAYHSTPKTITGVEGRPINAFVGFLSMLSRIWQEEKPRGVFVAFDTLGVDTYRTKLWPAYQGGRIFDKEIVEQLNALPEICRSFAMGVGKQAGYEADDMMAAAALAESAAGGSSLLLTTDKDSYQLVTDRITVLSPKRGTRELDRIGPHEVVERMGVLPEQVPDLKALMGDSSDKIPGISGVGPKAAASLLLRYGTLDKVIEGWNRPHDNELVLKFREICRMRPDVPVLLPSSTPNWVAGSEVLRSLGAANLADRLATLSAGP